MVTGGTCAAEGWDRPSRLFFPPLQRPSARWRPRRWARRSQRGPPARGRVGGGGGAPPGANTIANGVPPLTPARGFHRVAPTVSLSPLATAEAHGQFALIDHKPIASIRPARRSAGSFDTVDSANGSSLIGRRNGKALRPRTQVHQRARARLRASWRRASLRDGRRRQQSPALM